MAEFTVESRQKGEVEILICRGYLNREGGAGLRKAVEEKLERSRIFFVMDFSECTGLNSPGVGEIMGIAIFVTEDFRGKLILCGLDDLKRKVFDMAGIFQNAQEAPNEGEALQLASPESGVEP